MPAVISAWTKAAAETIASAGIMTSRPTPVPSFGMEAVVEMTTDTEQKMNARRLVFYSEQVTFLDFQQKMCTFSLYFHFFINIILFCPQQDKRKRSHHKVDFLLYNTDFNVIHSVSF